MLAQKTKIAKEQAIRDIHEFKNLGGFVKIYPVEGSEKYKPHLKEADAIW